MSDQPIEDDAKVSPAAIGSFAIPVNFDWSRLLLPGVFVLSLASCIFGVWYAIEVGDASHGGRGGALGVALSFAVLFVGRNIPKSILETPFGNDLNAILGEHAKPPLTSASSQDRVKLIARKNREALNEMIKWAKKEKLWLTLSSVISTLFWGFGDLFADWWIGDTGSSSRVVLQILFSISVPPVPEIPCGGEC